MINGNQRSRHWWFFNSCSLRALFSFHSSTFQTPNRTDLLPPSITSSPKTQTRRQGVIFNAFSLSFIPDLYAARTTAGNKTLGRTVKSRGSSTLPTTSRDGRRAFKVKGAPMVRALGSYRMETVEWVSFLGRQNSPTLLQLAYPSRELISELAGGLYNH